jgi:hypothetical protein
MILQGFDRVLVSNLNLIQIRMKSGGSVRWYSIERTGCARATTTMLGAVARRRHTEQRGVVVKSRGDGGCRWLLHEEEKGK